MLFFALADDLEDLKEKALLDTEELREQGPSGASDKVELDLEDAPFLEEEEEELPAPAQTTGLVLPESDEKPSLLELVKRHKFKVIGVGSVLFLLFLVAFYFLFFRASAPAPDLAAEPQAATAEPAPEPEEPAPAEHVVALEPFWVEHHTDNGTIRFLHCRFSAATTDEKLAWEVGHKKIVLRDAIFYYLKNKDLTFLTDKNNVETLKKDLLSVMNQYLSTAQLDTLLIEEYLVK